MNASRAVLKQTHLHLVTKSNIVANTRINRNTLLFTVNNRARAKKAVKIKTTQNVFSIKSINIYLQKTYERHDSIIL